jgi:hypothetical protein
MDPSDPVYAVCVAMAETLVPDVCTVIMGFLEIIHINEGWQKWKDQINNLNTEYHKVWRYYDFYVLESEMLRSDLIKETGICPCQNYRDVSGKGIYPYISHFSVVKRTFTGDICLLPENYVYARLFH